jgi:hypothetical protein
MQISVVSAEIVFDSGFAVLRAGRIGNFDIVFHSVAEDPRMIGPTGRKS